MNRVFYSILIIASVLFLGLSGCDPGSLDQSGNGHAGTTDIIISSSLPQQDLSSNVSYAVLGTANDIQSVYLDVTQEITEGTHYHVDDYPLTYSGGIWSATVDDLPIDTSISFVVRALNDNSTDIFSGTTQSILTGDGGSVTVNLNPIDDGAPNVIPIVAQIARPAEIIRLSTDATASFDFKGNIDETLSFDISADSEGSFVPATGTIVMSGSGTATQLTTYNAPASEGAYGYSVTLTNSQGNYVRTAFPTTVITPSTTADSGIIAYVSPVLVSISADRDGSEITLTADATDDGPLGELTYYWEYDGIGGLVFQNSSTNPAILQNYSPDVSGTIYLTVADGDGGETEIGIQLAVNQFPTTLITALEYQLPDTSQVDSYTETFGEDSDYTINPVGYSNNGDSTITDNNSLLMWEQSDAGSTLSQTNATTYCDNLSLGGYTDWRLPTIQELKDLTYFKSASPYIDEYYFQNVSASSYYWSSSVDVAGTSALTVSYSSGTITNQTITRKYYYRCARGDTLSSGSFSENYDGSVSDTVNKLVWQQGEATDAMNWESALAYCETLTLAGNNDWRLPNVKELYTLVDSSLTPTINTTFFPNVFSASYWTSTAATSSNRWFVNFTDGSTGDEGGTKTNYVRCVRSQQ